MSPLSRPPGDDQRETAEDRGQRPAEDPDHALALLFGRAHGDRRRFALGSGPVVLGREVEGEDGCHVQLDDPLVSRRHAELHWSELHGRYWIRDLGSRNGVHLNGAKVSRELIGCGDILRIGDAVLRLVVVERTARAPAADALDVAVEPPFVGRSASLRRSLDLAAQVAGFDTPVLILGPTGIGKELVASAIHRASRRRPAGSRSPPPRKA
ncbi:MAG TPA: FHA domain-containing protein [Kofleriaceae bacterium]|nr:FHA domain-containing protein [Kofleriaceae bacterium]